MKIFIHWYEDFLVWTNVKFNNGNWTGVEYNLVWDHTCDCAWLRVTARECDLESKVWFQTKIAQFNYHFIIAILKSQNSDSTNLMVPIWWPVCQNMETKSLLHLILYSKQKWCNIEQKSEWCDLEQMWFRAKNIGIRE